MTKSKQRVRMNGFDGRAAVDGYHFASNNFLREEIQPTVMRNYNIHSSYEHVHFGHQTNLSAKGSKKLCLSKMLSGVTKQYAIQPRRVTSSQNKLYNGISNASEMKKRSRSCSSRTTTLTMSKSIAELIIEGDAAKDIINELRLKTFEIFTEESSSVLFKGIRELPANFVNTTREDETKERMLLLSSLEDLVRKKGSSWKVIKIQECSPSVLEVLLDSQFSTDFEEIHIVGIRDDERYEADENLTQIEPSLESHFPSIARANDPRTHIAFLIASFLKKMTRIKKLVLRSCDLNNTDLNQIMNILCAHPNHPESLEHLDLRFNKLTPIAIQSVLGNHLKTSLNSLKTVKLRQGLRCVVNSNIRDAILQSLKFNRVVLENTDIFDWDKSVQYLLDINRAKRRSIMCNNDRFPTSLWPLLLEQVVIVNEGDDSNLFSKNNKSRYKSPLFVPRQRNSSSRRRQASVVYHIFRNGGAMLLQQRYSPSMDLNPSMDCIDLD